MFREILRTILPSSELCIACLMGEKPCTAPIRSSAGIYSQSFAEKRWQMQRVYMR